jgi:uncharacterized protein (DUF302 family)
MTPTVPVLVADSLNVPGLVRVSSHHGPRETMGRVVANVTARGMVVFARLDHGAGALAAGLELRPTELLLFGNARGGTPLMQSRQSIGIDLPLKILVWQDESGVTWVGYNDPDWVARRHGLAPDRAGAVNAMHKALAEIAGEAAGQSSDTMEGRQDG